MAETAYIIYAKSGASLVPAGEASAVGSRAALVKYLANRNGAPEIDEATYVVIPASNHHSYKPRVTTTVVFE